MREVGRRSLHKSMRTEFGLYVTEEKGGGMSLETRGREEPCSSGRGRVWNHFDLSADLRRSRIVTTNQGML